MHGSVRDRLENLLAAETSPAYSAGKTAAAKVLQAQEHLASCAECSGELGRLRGQAELLRSLRSPEILEPSAGFYARVLQRIEERAKNSIWAVFIYSPYGKRLAYASFTMALLLGSYVVAQEKRDGDLMGGPQVVQEAAMRVHHDALVAGSPDEQRDAVLENFASH